MIHSDLDKLSVWCQANWMDLNVDKYRVEQKQQFRDYY